MSDADTAYVLDKIIAILELIKNMSWDIEALNRQLTRLENAVARQMEAKS